MIDKLKKELKEKGSIRFKVKVVPNSSQTQSMGAYGTYLRVKIKSPAEKSRANQELIAFLRRKFSVSSVKIVSGQTSELKTVEIKSA